MAVISISVFNKCNNCCLMCTNPFSGNWLTDNFSLESLKKIIQFRKEELKQKREKVDEIYLSGGEPTIHPHFFSFLGILKKEFPWSQIKLLTNGRTFFYNEFAQEVLSIDKKIELIFSICGPNSKVHDSVTRTPGSFEQMITGLKNVLKLRNSFQRVSLRFVVSNLTKKHIFETLKFIISNFSQINEVAVIFMEIEGHAQKNIDFLRLRYNDEEMKKQLMKSLPFFKKSGKILLYHFPLCTLSWEFWPFVSKTLPAEEVIFIDKCQKCLVKELCLGLPRYYFENIENYQSEINPIKTKDIKIKKSNNFFIPIAEVAKV